MHQKLFLLIFLAAASSCKISTDITGSKGWAQLVLGEQHVCGLTLNGDLYCWGSNRDGQLGIGVTDTLPHNSPVAIPGGNGFLFITAGKSHTCAIFRTGDAYCWGSQFLGNGVQAGSATPVLVSGGISWGALAAGDAFTCGLTPQGRAFCWGTAENGALGIGGGVTNTSAALTPVPVSTDLAFRAIGAGPQHTCVLTSNGTPYCWGGIVLTNSGTTYGASAPFPVTGNLRLTGLSAGSVTCGVTAAEAGFCWPSSAFSEVTAQQTNPTPIPGTVSLIAVDAGRAHFCGITDIGIGYCWGSNSFGEAGVGAASGAIASPALVSGNLRFATISAGNYLSCGIVADGTGYCWGNNQTGQIGDGTRTNRAAPAKVLEPGS